MAIQPVQFCLNFPSKYEPIVKKTIEMALVGLTAQQERVHPIDYYWATRFIESSIQTLYRQGEHPQISWYDLAIYSVVVWMLSRFIPQSTVTDLFSSPTIIRKIITSPLYQSLRQAIRHFEITQIKIIVGNILREELPETPLTGEVAIYLQEKGVERLGEFIKEKQFVVGEIGKDVKDLKRILKDEGVFSFGLQVKETVHQLRELREFSLYPLIFGGKAKPTLYPRVMAAWGLGAEVHPALSPILFSSQTPDLPEFAIRAGGVLLTYQTNAPLFSTIATEVALKMVPENIRNHPFNRQTLSCVHHMRRQLTHQFRRLALAFRYTLQKEGFSEKSIDSMIKINTQLILGCLYGELSQGTSPLLIAFATTYFCSYLSVFLAHQGISDGAFLVSDSGVKAIPLKLAIGLGCSLLEGLSGRSQGGVALAAILSLPMVIDFIVDTKFYTKNVNSLIETAIPHFRLLERIAGVGHNLISSTVGRRMFYFLKYPLVVAISIATSAHEGIERHQAQKGLASIKKSAAWALATGMKYKNVRVFGWFLGTEAALLTNLISAPKDLETAAIGAIGVGVSISTGSPLAGVLAMEAATPVIRSHGGQNLFNRIRNKVTETLRNLIFSLIPPLPV